MTGRLANKVALVTGIGAGIGRGIALTFAAEGAYVIGCDIDVDRARETTQDAAAQGTPIATVEGSIDLTRPVDVGRYIDSARSSFGRIDVLVNAGAIAPPMAPVSAMDFDTQWSPTLAGEVDLVFLAVKEAWPLLKASGNASIINFASVAAVRGSRGIGMVAHSAGKGAVLAMTRQLAVEGAADRIRANTIAPGLVESAATELSGATVGELREMMVSQTLTGRIGTPEDIAWCAVYLASNEASWVTGASFAVDGGVTAV